MQALPSPSPCADDLIAFLQRSAAALKPGGVLIVKENVCEKGFVVDNSDASVTRWARKVCGKWSGTAAWG